MLHEITGHYIDLTDRHHYYARMNHFLIMLVAGAVLLGGCTHTATTSKNPARNADVLSPSTVTVNAPEAEAIADTDADGIGEQGAETVAVTDNRPVANPTPVPALEQQPANLLNRIRAGFRLPNLQSPHISTYEQWSSEHPTYLANLFARAEPFLFYIVEEIEERGLPMELALLPAIESAFKPNALSRSRAGGIWQFIPATGRHYGLRQDWWYDGRRDLIESTGAALDYLSHLNALFEGDWFLALAAYNAGQGTVNKALKRNKRKHQGLRYQDLPLRTETKRYVPKLLALKNIISDPGAYGVHLPHIPDQPHFTTLQLPGQIDLHKFARNSRIDLAELQHLNAGFLRWATSPLGPHRLLVPLDAEQQALANVEQLQRAPALALRNHRIRTGETLSGIGRKYGVSVAALKTTNKLSGSAIRAGKNLLVPVSAAGDQVLQTRDGITRHVPASAAESGKLIHRVRSGDTLWSIARRYQVEVKQLLSWNQLSVDKVLQLGQKLLVVRN